MLGLSNLRSNFHCKLGFQPLNPAHGRGQGSWVNRMLLLVPFCPFWAFKSDYSICSSLTTSRLSILLLSYDESSYNNQISSSTSIDSDTFSTTSLQWRLFKVQKNRMASHGANFSFQLILSVIASSEFPVQSRDQSGILVFGIENRKLKWKPSDAWLYVSHFLHALGESNSNSLMHVPPRASYMAASSVPILKYVTMQLLPLFKSARPASVGKAFLPMLLNWVSFSSIVTTPL